MFQMVTTSSLAKSVIHEESHPDYTSKRLWCWDLGQEKWQGLSLALCVLSDVIAEPRDSSL